MDCSRAKTRDPEEWIESAPAFSRVMAAQVREWIQRWEPDLEEAIKWNMACFFGRRLVCGLSACKKHLGITFFRGTELPDPTQLFSGGENNTSILSLRLKALDGFDRDAFRKLLRAAVVLDVEPMLPPPPKVKRAPWPMPDFFVSGLKENKKAAAFYAALAPTYQREYLVWLATAKRKETRVRRLEQTLNALAAGRKWIERKRA